VDEERREAIIAFLCSESGSHDHTINRREARGMGLAIENASPELYCVVKALHDSMSETMATRTPFSPDTELSGRQHRNYFCSRVLIESPAHGSHQYISEGSISRVEMNPSGSAQIGIQDVRTFEGWRKIA